MIQPESSVMVLGAEDSGDYTEVDPATWITINSGTSVRISGDLETSAYLYRDLTADAIDDFTIEETIDIITSTSNGRNYASGVATSIGDGNDWTDAIFIRYRYSTGDTKYQVSLENIEGGVTDLQTYLVPSGAPTYYPRLVKAGVETYLELWSDSDRTSLVTNLTFTRDSDDTFQYLYWVSTDDVATVGVRDMILDVIDFIYTPAGAGGDEGVWEIITDNDDANYRAGTAEWFGLTSWLMAGDSSATLWDYASGFRFQNISIPQGSTITGAWLELHWHSIQGNDPDLVIWGEDADDVATFVNAGDFTGRTRTSANVTYAPTGISSETRYNTSDIKTIVQEIVDRGGWDVGQDMGFFINHSSTGWIGAEERGLWYAYDMDVAKTPRLYVTWTEGESAPNSTVTLSAPADNLEAYTGVNTSFTFTPTWYVGQSLVSLQLFTNETGTWTNRTYQITGDNATVNTIYYTPSLAVKSVWNVKLITSLGSYWASSNRTMTHYASTSYENFILDWTENNAGGIYSTNGSHLIVDGDLRVPSDRFYGRDSTTGQNDWDWYFDLNLTEMGLGTLDNRGIVIGISEDKECEEDADTALREFVGVLAEHDDPDKTTYGLELRDVYDGTLLATSVTPDTRNYLNVSQLYYIHWQRTDTTINLYIYKDRAMTDPVSEYNPLTQTLQADYSNLDEMSVFSSLEDGLQRTMTAEMGYLRETPTHPLQGATPVNVLVSHNSTEKGANVEFISHWTQENATLTYALFEWDISGSYQVVANISMSGVDDWANYTTTFPTNRSSIGYRFRANNSLGNVVLAGNVIPMTEYEPVNTDHGVNATIVTKNAEFYSSWTQGGSGRTLDTGILEIDTGGGFVEIDDVSVSGGWANFTYLVPWWMQGATWDWRVIVNNTLGESTTSPTWNFTVDDPSPVSVQDGTNSTAVNTTCLFYAEWTEDATFPIDTVLFTWYKSGWESIPVTLSGGWTNTTIFFDASFSGLSVDWYFTANNTAGNETLSSGGYVDVDDWNAVASGISHGQEHGGLSTDFTCFLNTSLPTYPALETVIFQYSVSGNNWVNTSVTVTGTPMWANLSLTLPKAQNHELVYRWYYKNTEDGWTSSTNSSFTVLLNVVDDNGFYWEYFEYNADDFFNADPPPYSDYVNEFVRVYWENSTDAHNVMDIDTYNQNQTDFSDVGFWYENGTTRMTYAVHLFDKANYFARIALKIPVSEFDNTTNTIKFWCRWGGSASDWEDHDTLAHRQDVFPYYDDFEDGVIDTSIWTVTGNVTETGGNLVIGNGGMIESKETFNASEYIGMRHDFAMKFLAEDWGLRFDAWQDASHYATIWTQNDPLPPSQYSTDVNAGSGDYFTSGVAMSGSYDINPLGFRIYLQQSQISLQSSQTQDPRWTWSNIASGLERGEGTTYMRIRGTTANTAWIRWALGSREVDGDVTRLLPWGSIYPSGSGNSVPVATNMEFTNLESAVFIVTGSDKNYEFAMYGTDAEGGETLDKFFFALELSGAWINGTYDASAGTLTSTAGGEYISLFGESSSYLTVTGWGILQLRFHTSTPIGKMDGWLRVEDELGALSSWVSFPLLAEVIVLDDGGGGGGGGSSGGGTGGGAPVYIDPETGLPVEIEDEPEYLFEVTAPNGVIVGIFPLPWDWTRAQTLSVLWILLLILMMLAGYVLKSQTDKKKRKKKLQLPIWDEQLW